MLNEFLRGLLGKVPTGPVTFTGRPGEVIVPGVGIRKITNTEHTPLYYGVTVPPGMCKGSRLGLFGKPGDPFVTNIIGGDRLGAGCEAVIYRIRIGFAPEADLTMADIMGITSTAYLYLKFAGTVEVEGGLMFFPFALYAGAVYTELTEILPCDKEMVKPDEAETPEDTSPPRIMSARYVQGEARLLIPIHIRSYDERPQQFEGNVSFKFQSKNLREVKLYVIMDSFLMKPLR